MDKERASKKQLELLTFVDDFIRAHGYGPSYREIMTGLNYKSVSTVATHLNGLISKGYVVRKDKSARSLEIVNLSSPNGQVSNHLNGTEQAILEQIDKTILDAGQSEAVSQALRLLGYEHAARQAARKNV